MRRTKAKNIKKADAILLSDWHIREDSTMCRTDNYWETQETKIDYIVNLAKQNSCPILCGGDLGHKAKWSCRLLEFIIDKFKGIEIIMVAGNHDLPEHRIEYWKESGIGVLHAAGAVNVIRVPKTINEKFNLFPFQWGEEVTEPEKLNDLPNVAIIHQMIIENKLLWADQVAPKGHELLKKNTRYNLILTGDNHHAFVSEDDGRILVNPGSIMRMTAAQIDFKPRVYKWFADKNEIQVCYLPIEKDVVTADHIKKRKLSDDKIEKFAKRMSDNFEIDLSFEQNIENYFVVNRTKKAVKEKVFEVIKHD